MVRLIAALAAGLVFGIGLSVSQMVNPAKVIGFLDFAGAWAGAWDPSLGLVLGGAVAASGAAFVLARRMRGPLLAKGGAMPVSRAIELRLGGGSALFGIGWGLVGFCPGPAIAALALGRWEPVIFVASMVAGMALFRLIPLAVTSEVMADA